MKDNEAQVSRRKSVKSQTKVSFFDYVNRYSIVSMDLSTTERKTKSRIITFHLFMPCREERENDTVKCFISYAKPRGILCKVLLGVWLMDLKPASGGLICHPNVGLQLSRMVAMMKAKKAIIPTVHQKESISASLMKSLYDSECAINRIFLLIDINDYHLGLLLMERKMTDDGSEERLLSFGDSLKFKCLIHVYKF